MASNLLFTPIPIADVQSITQDVIIPQVQTRVQAGTAGNSGTTTAVSGSFNDVILDPLNWAFTDQIETPEFQYFMFSYAPGTSPITTEEAWGRHQSGLVDSGGIHRTLAGWTSNTTKYLGKAITSLRIRR